MTVGIEWEQTGGTGGGDKLPPNKDFVVVVEFCTYLKI